MTKQKSTRSKFDAVLPLATVFWIAAVVSLFYAPSLPSFFLALISFFGLIAALLFHGVLRGVRRGKALVAQARRQVMEAVGINWEPPKMSAHLTSDPHLVSLWKTLEEAAQSQGEPIQSAAWWAQVQLNRGDAASRGFEEILRTKLNPGELTFQRYLGAGHAVQAAHIRLIQEVITAMKSIEGIPKREKSLIKTRQIERIHQSLQEGESALQGLTAVNVAVSEMKTTPGHVGLDSPPKKSKDKMAKRLAHASTSQSLEEALQELDRLAKRAGGY